MQASKCPECGVVIGGGNHTLAAGNRHADAMLQAARINLEAPEMRPRGYVVQP